ncbi:hypothetical protein PVAP13_6KG267506 [Panicum virgatum]|uniref:Uncharacterized protein n=1 Tax=Panicum virgatum TaxID=38727 RepID=A0A8T0RG00_PANVG|nr:hypothetical protein PVAP13_6KG267506 [Panicum virgatum]
MRLRLPQERAGALVLPINRFPRNLDWRDHGMVWLALVKIHARPPRLHYLTSTGGLIKIQVHPLYCSYSSILNCHQFLFFSATCRLCYVFGLLSNFISIEPRTKLLYRGMSQKSSLLIQR